MLTRRVSVPPPEPTTKISAPVFRLLVNAILVPSGDHEGWVSCPVGLLVTCRPPPPLASITQISLLDVGGSATRTMLVPSGDHVGSLSCTVEVLVKFVGVPVPS